MRKYIFGIGIVLLLSFWSLRPLGDPGFFPMHDDTQVGRVVAMGRALRNGQFPVRWVSELGYGYGYPIFNFYGPLPYYVGGSLYALGLTGLAATKMMFALGIVGAGIAMYLALSPFVGHLGAIVASAFYMYAPYHAVQIYVRGAVGEFWVLVFLPLVFFGLGSKSKLIGGIGLAGAILSHTLLGYATTVLLVFGLILYWAYRRLPSHVSLLAIGLGFSAFFWLPAIFEFTYTNVRAQISPTANYVDHFVCLGQLWNAPWGFGGSTAGCVDGISFKLGKLHIIGALAGVLAFWLNRKKDLTTYILIALGSMLTALFFTLPISGIIWKTIPQFAYIQYPWRFLTIAIFGLALLTSLIIAFSRNTLVRMTLAVISIAAVIFLNAKLFMPQYVYPKTAESFETTQELRFRVSKISDEYLPPEIIRPNNPEEAAKQAVVSSESLDVETEIDREVYAKFAVLSKVSQTLVIHRAYFPGWRYWVNGKETAPNLVNGLPELPIPEGRSVVEMHFTNTFVRTLGNLISVTTLVLVIYIYGKKNYA